MLEQNDTAAAASEIQNTAPARLTADGVTSSDVAETGLVDATSIQRDTPASLAIASPPANDVAGWKVGATSKEVQELFGIAGPVYGPISGADGGLIVGASSGRTDIGSGGPRAACAGGGATL